MPSNYLSSWYGTALHMGLGPLLGVIRICTLENWINQPQLKATWEGLEAFWDLGQELINQRTVTGLKNVALHTHFCPHKNVCAKVRTYKIGKIFGHSQTIMCAALAYLL